MRKFKRFVAGLLAVACCFSVVGCGKDGDGKKTTTTAFVGKEDIKVTTPDDIEFAEIIIRGYEL